MKTTDDRKLFGTPIGASAASGNIATIPQTQATAGDGTASVALGFPPETFIARAAGGEPPRGQDMNGLLNLLSSATQVLQAGYLGPFDPGFAQSIGGYPAGAVVAGSAPGAFWVSTAEANVSTPGTGGAAWQSLFSGYATQAWANGKFLQLANAAVQTVAGPVTFSGITKVPTPTDYTQKQAIGASDADARYARLSGGNTFSGNQVVSAGYLQLQSTTAGKYATMQSVVSGGVTLLNGNVGGLGFNLREDTGRFYMSGSASGTTAFQSDFYVIAGGSPVANGGSVSTSVSWTPTATGVALVSVTAATHDDSINTANIIMSGSGYSLVAGGMAYSGSPQVVGTYYIQYTVGTAVTLNAKATFASACNGEIRLFVTAMQNGA